jgi:hypothetical protein
MQNAIHMVSNSLFKYEKKYKKQRKNIVMISQYYIKIL